MNTLLEIKNITKYYGSGSNVSKALNGVSFSMERGEFTAVMGASGSGKSTLLNVIATIDRASSGSILLEGRDIAEMKEQELAAFRRDHLGFIFQEYNLLDTLTVGENIVLPLNLQRKPVRETQDRLQAVAASLEITEQLDKFPRQLSGGQRQRAACARALITEPALILADEPTGALDSANSKSLMQTLTVMNRELYSTILMVTHDAIVGSYASRILFLKDGKIWNELYRGDRTRQTMYHEILNTMAELLKTEAAEKSEKHPVLWCVLSAVTLAGLVASLIVTYQNLMAAFRNQDGVILLLWLAVDLVMVFLSHFTLSRTIAGMLLRIKKLKNRGANTVVLRGLSGKMTVNSLLIGALATLLVFAIAMSNVALGEKVYSDRSVAKDCPYDVMAMLDNADEPGISMEEGEKIIGKYSPILSRMDYQLYSTGETTLCSSILGYDIMGWTDKYMPLSQFNALLTGCGYDPITLEGQYLVITSVQGIGETDFPDKTVHFNGTTYSWVGSSTRYPEFARQAWMYFVVPDEAVTGMPVSDVCAAYTLKNHRPDSQAILKELTYFEDTPYGPEKRCDFAIREEYRLWNSANAGTLIIGALYVSTVFVCMALAILSVKTLSTLDGERRRFAVLYRLGADVRMQKSALLRQTGAFFLMPFAFPLLMTVPMGVIFGKVYEIWDFAGLSGQKAMETAVLIALVIAGVYAMYFLITYYISCSHVICHGADGGSKDGRL